MEIERQNSKFILKYNDGRTEFLFDLFDCVSNCSRIPMHRIDSQGNIIFSTYEFLKKVLDDLQAANIESGNGLFNSVAYLIIYRELIKKYRSFRVLHLGVKSPLIEHLSKLLQMLHPRATLYCLTDNRIEIKASDLVLINAEYNTYPFPRNYFDVILTDCIHPDIIKRIFPDLLMSIVVNGLFIALPSKHGSIEWLDEIAHSIGETNENRLIYMHIPEEKVDVLRILKMGSVEIKKALILQQIYGLEQDILQLSKSKAIAGNDQLDYLIFTVSQVENEICLIYDELVSLDIKYRISLLKEALIRLRLEKDEIKFEKRINKIVDCYSQLKSELKYDFSESQI